MKKKINLQIYPQEKKNIENIMKCKDIFCLSKKNQFKIINKITANAMPRNTRDNNSF